MAPENLPGLPQPRAYLERQFEVFTSLQRQERVVRSGVLEVMSVHGHHPARHHGAPGKRGREQTAVQNPECLGVGMAGGGSPGAQRVDSGLSQTSGLLIARLGPSEHVTSPGVS